jgi:hypothetical protein
MTDAARAQTSARAADAARAQTSARPARKPGPGAVLWGSVALFAVLFALLTYQVGLSSFGGASSSRPVLVRKIVNHRIVTTYVPSPGATSVSTSPAQSSESGATAPITTGAS